MNYRRDAFVYMYGNTCALWLVRDKIILLLMDDRLTPQFLKLLTRWHFKIVCIGHLLNICRELCQSQTFVKRGLF